MKKQLFLLVIIILFAAVIIGCKKSNDMEYDYREQASSSLTDSSHAFSDTLSIEGNEFSVELSADYIAIYPEDLYNLSDLVIRAQYLGDEMTFIGNNTFPVTTSKFQINTVYKGSTENKIVYVDHYGGTLKISDYAEILTEDQFKKRGWDTAKPDDTVSLVNREASVELDIEAEYVLFVSYNPQSEEYFILCDGYGVCRVNGDDMYCLAEDTYIPIDSIVCKN